jgi:hypothetical protein
MKETYYVYVLQNPKKPLRFSTDKYGLKYEPFYVGKGSGDRSEVHYEGVISRNSSHNQKLTSEINKLRTYGVKPVVTKVFITKDEEKAYEKESEIISHYGIRYKDGLLVNAGTGKAGGWGGELNPTFHRMQIGTHNFQTSNPQVDTLKITKLKKMILEVEKSESLLKRKWRSRTGYSNLKSIKVGIHRIIQRDNLPYYVTGNTITKKI